MEFIIEKVLTKDVKANKFSFDNPTITESILKKNDLIIKMSVSLEDVTVYKGDDRGTFYKISKNDWDNSAQ